ncbi:Germin-like protein subfamily 1 member 18 [Hibiscus syriacus]|uniref:Germin-like protein subfamily 1 member 18 n=1 Tax=Hibiscus syriacus TaxID=106335 RepID=A0A6A3C4V9_HIBSY|nr:U-box domain-containing protein 9-like [Hibiscus syriacus]KAE8723834.1 Germin-like protein subfamily 1 member 18 [Hibiscus syriacus]
MAETELKKELQTVVKKIVEDDDYGFETTIEAIKILSSLADFKIKKPLLGEFMGDIVALASTQTYSRPHMKKWLKECNITWPQSQKELYQGVDGKAGTEVDPIYLNSLLGLMTSSSDSDRKRAAKELRRLTKNSKSYRAAICEFKDAIPRLLSPLSETKTESDPDPDLCEDLITTVFNASLHANNKKQLAENPAVIPLLIEYTMLGTIETRRNAAATLGSLSALDSNKFIIGDSGAVAPLIELLRGGHPSAIRDAASTIYTLCKVRANNAKFVEQGAVEVVLEKINDGILVDELLVILAMLSTNRTAIDELGDCKTLQSLLRIIRHSSSECSKENCVAILYNVCSKDLTLLMVIRGEEIKKQTLAKLADTGTTRARRKAISIILKIHKAFPALSIGKYF